MQEIKKKLAEYKEKIRQKIKQQSKIKKIIILAIVIILLASCIITLSIQTIKQIKIKQIENKPLLEYEIKDKINRSTYEILIKINSTEGIETVKYINPKTNNEVQLNTNGKMTVGIDYVVEDQKSYDIKIKIKGKEEVTEKINFEIKKVQGNYSLDDGLYVNEPDLTGYNSDYTRYLNINEQGNLEPGNWIKNEKPTNWYNYKNSEWANIYVENNGLETYYVWIPRYCFKLDQEKERSEIKFIDINDNYKDENGNITTWEELEKQGYQIPEAFEFDFTRIPGYWAMKYTAGERNTYTIDYDTVTSKTKISMKTIKTNTTDTIVKYRYAINGTIIKESTTPENFEKEMNTEGSNIVNITAINSNGEIVGSMTKECKQAKVNKPELSQFSQETTFYVTYDENDNEHSTVPISQAEPNDWYDYGDSKWANIVTRNNGLETYFTWIPRYEFQLNQTSQRSKVNFIEGTSTKTSDEYQIPEAFTFNGQELTGYWAMKYTAGEATAPTFSTEVTATSSSIKTKGITGTLLEKDLSGKTVEQVYKYYINGVYKGESTDSTASFEYTGLNSNTNYTILVEIRNKSTDEYIGTIVKQIKTKDANKPELTGFNAEMTYYVLYDDLGNEPIGNKIKNNGSNMPTNWYNYSESKWANIVVTDGQVKNGQIENATKTTYFTWIPRYEFMITSSEYAQPAQGRTEVRFIEGTSTKTDVGYQIPEAFTFNGQELTGYWAMKYTVGE